MKFLLFPIALICLGLLPSTATADAVGKSDRKLARAFEKKISGFTITLRGGVVAIFSDDLEGDRHQRFLVELATGQTLLIAHNIDIAPRVRGLRPGDRLAIRGVYEWNREGGVIHWTHHDPDGSGPDGWIRHKGKKYR